MAFNINRCWQSPALRLYRKQSPATVQYTHLRSAFSTELESHRKQFGWLSMLPSKVTITDVSPRDGLQNESKDKIIPAEIKIDLIQKLQIAGLKKIECGSFVSPKWTPQMANSGEVFEALHEKPDPDPSMTYVGLILNQKGLERAIDKQVREVLYVLSASEAFATRNMNCSVQEAYDRMAPMIQLAKDNDTRFRVIIACSLGCPYEGAIDPDSVCSLMHKMSVDYSAKEVADVCLADTIGVATAGTCYTLLDKVLNEKDYGFDIGVHFHDTYGQALSNILTSVSMGVSMIESSVGGIGGCPFAKGATGNVATEDIVYMLNGMGIETGIDLDRLMEASNFITNYLNKPENASSVTRALNAKK